MCISNLDCNYWSLSTCSFYRDFSGCNWCDMWMGKLVCNHNGKQGDYCSTRKKIHVSHMVSPFRTSENVIYEMKRQGPLSSFIAICFKLKINYNKSKITFFATKCMAGRQCVPTMFNSLSKSWISNVCISCSLLENSTKLHIFAKYDY